MLARNFVRGKPLVRQPFVRTIRPQRFYSDTISKPKKRIISWKTVTLGLAGTAVVFYNTNDNFHDFTRHVFLTFGRVKVVGQATARCLYHYKKTLGAEYQDDAEYQNALQRCHKRCANITLKALERNGGVFIKLGQHLGAMTYLLPSEWTDTMTPLQDKCPQSTMLAIDRMFQQDLKCSLDEMFSEFDPTPIGVASLAQVHVAKLKSTGEKVAVKCQHPELKEFVPLDVMLTQTVFNLLDVVFPEYPLSWLGDELQSSIYVELDFSKEAENAKKSSEDFASYTRKTALRIPEVLNADKRILILEYIHGERLDNVEYMNKHNISRSEVSSCLSHIFNRMIFTPNVGIHCDPHGGNLAIRSLEKSRNGHNFEIILYDHGLYRTPTTQMRQDYAKFWLALLDQDQDKMHYYAKKFAHIGDDQVPLFAAAITGRSIDTAMNYDIAKPRSQEEIVVMSSKLTEGDMLIDLMSILSKIPRIVLLILKTNDLTRHLDECLQNPLGPERTFLIMTQYCAKIVYDEAREKANKSYTRWSVRWIFSELQAWIQFQSRKNQLVLYDIALWWKNKF
ncbi:unnamed protein product [Kluyveromyces dobzhanskii CBS 2104]|uniref:WGS project CCBQ000000000 data, contig 00058 n=1 Tax=Kluyveromyces dobzhanskii CBS 2104 TaxID=1427455 RepID=A0A0A8LBE7_9SACH|nr:unnamed protein product [Kluyveromyces dobzhanskii CBS 2104]